MMKRVILALTAAVATVGATGAMAMFAAMSLDDLYAGSVLIVTGEIGGVESAGDHREGWLAVDQTLKGTPGDEVRVWMLPEDGLRKSDDVAVPVGQSGLWFLTPVPGSDGLYRIDHPMRFVPQAQAAPMIEEIGRR